MPCKPRVFGSHGSHVWLAGLHIGHTRILARKSTGIKCYKMLLRGEIISHTVCFIKIKI